jgi:hypothetical protein
MRRDSHRPKKGSKHICLFGIDRDLAISFLQIYLSEEFAAMQPGGQVRHIGHWYLSGLMARLKQL